MARPKLQGPRLPYVVIPLEGTCKVIKKEFDRRTGKIKDLEMEEPAGWLVLYPRGHFLHIRRAEDLIRYRLNTKPMPIMPDGMIMHPTQDPKKAYESLQADIVDVVRATNGGSITIPGYTGKIKFPVRQQEENYA